METIPVNDNSLEYTQPGIPVEENIPVNVSASTAGDRAYKADKILGEKSPGIDVLATQISTGQEGYLRQDIANTHDLNRQQEVINQIKEQAALGKFPTTEELRKIAIVPTNPETAIESLYGDKYVAETVAAHNEPTDVVRKAMETNPESTLRQVEQTKNIISRNEVAKTLSQEIADKWENTSWLSARGIGDTVAQFMPLYEWGVLLRLRNASPGNNGFLPGEILRQKAQQLYAITDPYEFKLKMQEEIEALSVHSYPVAVQYANAMVAYGASDEFLDNVFGALDLVDVVATVGALDKGLIKEAKKALEGLTEAFKDSVKANSLPTVSTPDIKVAQGDIPGAAADLLKQKIASFKDADVTNNTLPIRQVTKSLFNPDVLTRGNSATAIEFANRLETVLKTNASNLIDAFINSTTVPRIMNEQALDTAIESAKKEIFNKYNQAIDGLIDFKIVRPDEDVVTNTGVVRAQFGRKDATPFTDREEARFWMEEQYKLARSQYTILDEGGKFFGVVDQYLPETADAVRDVLIDTNATTPKNWFGRLVDATKLALNPRGGDEIVSQADMASRQLANSASHNLMRVMGQIAADTIGTLGKTKYQRFNRLLEADRAWVGPDGTQGRYLKNLDEYEAQYRAMFNEPPTENEVAAYFTAVQLSDFDYMVRDTGLFRDMARQGIENIRFKSKEAFTPNFKGKFVDTLPDPSKSYSILIQNKDGTSKVHYSRSLTPENRQYIDELLATNSKLVQVYDPVSRPLKSVTGTDEVINFVLTDSAENSKLTLGNLPYKAGGHREYVSPHFVKQAKIGDYADSGRKIYEGDAVAFGFETAAEGRKYAERMEKARQLMNSGGDLSGYLSRNLPFNQEQFKAFFEEATDPKGNIIAPRFSKDEPFRYVESNQSIYDAYSYKDRTDLENLADNEFNLASENDRRFLAQRDPELWSVQEVHRSGGLAYELSTARQLDPLSSITRTMRSVMEARYINDYKIGAIERWIEEFAPTMNVSKEELRRNPTYYFNNPEWNEKYSDKFLLAAARQSAANIKNFLGVESIVDKEVNTITQRLLDGVYGTLGQRVSDYTAQKLSTVTDPSRFFRGMAFHLNMGLFSPVQIAVQGQSAFLNAAISPKHGPVASMYAIASQMTALTKKPQVLRRMEEMLDKVGLDGKVFTESNRELQKTGFDFVGGESMWSEGTLTPKVFSSKTGQVLDAGTVFFKGTERFLRLSAWHTAFREFREVNPDKVITAIDRANLIKRANTLSINMTNASKANWEKGILSIPTQFMSYQARLTDLILGKELSRAEKARVVGTLGMLYGVGGAGAAVTGYGAYESLRTYALDNGYDLKDPVISGILEGIPHLVAQQMGLGEWNYSSRYGPSGFTAIQDLIEGDKTLVETLMGPSGSIFNQSVKQTMPTLWGITKMLRSDDPDMTLTAQDFTTAAHEMSTGILRSSAIGNTAFNLYMAYTAGQYISRNNLVTAETDTLTSLITGLTGLQPSEIPDTYLLIKNKKDWQEFRKATDAGYINFYRRSLMAYSEGNTSLGDSYQKQAKVMLLTGRYNPKETADLYKRAIKDQGNLVGKIRDDYWKNAPAGTQPQRMERVLEN